LHATFEEGTSAAWLYVLLKPHVTNLLVCDPRKNASMREGNQSDKIDARRLAELLRLNHLNPVYHGEHGLRSLKELVRSYLTITKDLGRQEPLGRPACCREYPIRLRFSTIRGPDPPAESVRSLLPVRQSCQDDGFKTISIRPF
jgi:hypothetical protein